MPAARRGGRRLSPFGFSRSGGFLAAWLSVEQPFPRCSGPSVRRGASGARRPGPRSLAWRRGLTRGWPSSSVANGAPGQRVAMCSGGPQPPASAPRSPKDARGPPKMKVCRSELVHQAPPRSYVHGVGVRRSGAERFGSARARSWSTARARSDGRWAGERAARVSCAFDPTAPRGVEGSGAEGSRTEGSGVNHQ
jgi:hypothetical protein